VTYDGSAHTATGTATGVGGLNLNASLALTGTTHTNAGTYTDTWIFHDDSTGNYADATSTVSDLIKQAPLTITANDKSIILDAALPTFNGNYSGFVSGQGPGALSGSLTCSSTTDGKSIGTFAINCSGQTSSNYNISYKPGTLTVQYAGIGICAGDVGHQILQPINADGTSIFSSKSTSPAKFRVCDANGVSIGTPGVVKSFVLSQVASGTALATVNEPVDATTPDLMFRWDPSSQQWIFNISNKGLSGPNKTYYFLVTLNDGSLIAFNYGLK
jgi:hypothetical protein